MRILPILSTAAILGAAAMATPADPRRAFSEMKPWFEPSASGAEYHARLATVDLTVAARGAVLSKGGAATRLSFAGSEAGARLEGVERRAGVTNYLRGARPGWRTGVAQYGKVVSRGLYRGVDLVYYSTGKQLEYDFVIAAGADAGAVRLRFAGVKPVLREDGSMLLGPGLIQKAPVAYQVVGGERVAVASRYRLEGGEVVFELGAYDRSRELVIDPVVDWAAFFGGDKGEVIQSVAAAGDGSYWVAGSSHSVIEIAANTDPLRWERHGIITSTTVTVAMDATTTEMEVAAYSTFPSQAPFTVVVEDEVMVVTDGAGTATWTVERGAEGTTAVAHAKAAVINHYAADTATTDAFLAQMAPEAGGWRMKYFTYIGGSADDEATAIAMSGKRVAIAGNTASLDFPLSGNAFQDELNGEVDSFVMLYDPTVAGNDCVTFSSYFGGELTENTQALAVGPKDRIAVVGYTNSGTLVNVLEGMALQPHNQGGVEGFVYVVQPFKDLPESFLHATYFGGYSTDIVSSVAFDSKGRVWFAGTSMSENMPVSDNAHRPYPIGIGDGFVAAIDPDQFYFDSFVYGSYFGGSDLDSIQSMAVDGQDRVWVAGYTFSDDLPVSPGAYQASRRGGADAFVARLDMTKTGAGWVDVCSYYGGRGGEVPYAMALNQAGTAVTIAGYTNSPDFPVGNVTGSVNATAQLMDMFAARFEPAQSGAGQLVWSALFGGAGNDVATAVVLDGAGDAVVAGYSNSPRVSAEGAGAKPASAGFASGVVFKVRQ